MPIFLATMLLIPCAEAQKPMMPVARALPLSAKQTAKAIGLLSLFEEVEALKSQSDPATELKLIALKQQILLRVTMADLQVDAASNEIDAEIAETRELENYLSGRRDNREDLLNLISLGAGGVAGTASSALGFTVHDRASSVTGLVAGGSTAVISLIELHVRHGHPEELHAPTNMLSEIFGRSPAIANFYPVMVVKFMASVPPDDPDGCSRRDRLVENWVKIGRIPDPNSKRGRMKIEKLTSRPEESIRQSIGDLDDRQAMLYDFRTRLDYIKRDLADLLEHIASANVTSPAQPQMQ